MEFYESHYFIVLIPAVVITVIFLFFWLFMRETTYDEILAKQKRDQKPLTIKAEKKKNEKKKNKKKEHQNGNLQESDSENASREFELTDALIPDDEIPVPIPLAPLETSGGVRERKKKEKKQSKLMHEEEMTLLKPVGKTSEPVPVTKQPSPPLEDIRAKKKPGQKKQKNGEDESSTTHDVKAEVTPSIAKKADTPIHTTEVKQQEPGTGKKKGAPKKQRTEPASLVEETLIHPMTYIPLMDNTEPSSSLEKKMVIEHEKMHIIDGIYKAVSKKPKNEIEKENADVKFKEFMSVLKNMTFTQEEAICVADAVKSKFGGMQDAWQKQSGKGETAAVLHQLQEKEKTVVVLQEEASIAKEKVKLLNQELVAEKQKATVMEAKLRERNSTLERDLGSVQNKLQVTYQESQQIQVKFQQLQEQLESQIARLQQENKIFRDAMPVSSQKESKQSSEIASLRQECGRLTNELSEKNNKLQQEELHKKNAEQTVAQLKVQLQELQNYVRNVKAEHNKAEAGKQELQNKLRNAESEIQNLSSKLADTMVSKEQYEQSMRQLLEDRTASEEQLHMQVKDLISQKEALKSQVQKLHTQLTTQGSTASLVEELQKTIADKDKLIKQTEESLVAQRACLATKEDEIEDLKDKNISLKLDLHQLNAQLTEQSCMNLEVEQLQRSIQSKEEKTKHFEELLQAKHLLVSCQEEELLAMQNENQALQKEIQKFQSQLCEQVTKDDVEEMKKSIQEKDAAVQQLEELLNSERSSMRNLDHTLKVLQDENVALKEKLQEFEASMANQAAKDVEEMQRSIQEKEDKIKTLEELLESGLIEWANKEENIKALKKENEVLQIEVQDLRALRSEQISSAVLEDDLLKQIHEKDGRIKAVEEMLQTELLQSANKDKIIQALEQQNNKLKEEFQSSQAEQVSSLQQRVEDLQHLLHDKEKVVEELKTSALQRDEVITNFMNESQTLHKENKSLRSEINILEQQNIQQVHSVEQHENMQKELAEKEMQISDLGNELCSLRAVVDQQRMKNNECQQRIEMFEKQIREMLQRLFPTVPLPNKLNNHEDAKEFERLAKEHLNTDSVTDHISKMEQKLKESEEMRVMIQMECEKYKSVLAETEGILQRLQSSVEEEEGKWKMKLENSQKELRQMHLKVGSLEQEVEGLRRDVEDAESLRKEQEHLEVELEKAEIERTVYVAEVRELKDLLNELRKKLDDSYSEAVRQNEELNLLKTQLNETLVKLDREQKERETMVGDLNKAQYFLDFLQREIVITTADSNVIVDSEVISTEAEEQNKKELSTSLHQTVTNVQQLLQAVNQQLIKGNEYSTMGEFTGNSSV